MSQKDDKQYGLDAKDRYALMEGTPEEKINTWLKLTKNPDGHYKAGVSPSAPHALVHPAKHHILTSMFQDWMASLVPHLKLVSVSPSMPHPSITISYTVQSDHCNRLHNLHGGCAATLFDFITTLPLSLINKPGFWQYLGVSRTLNTTYFRPVPAGVEVTIEAEIVQVGRKLATIRGTMRRRSDGAIMAVCEHGKANVDAEYTKL